MIWAEQRVLSASPHSKGLKSTGCLVSSVEKPGGQHACFPAGCGGMRPAPFWDVLFLGRNTGQWVWEECTSVLAPGGDLVAVKSVWLW